MIDRAGIAALVRGSTPCSVDEFRRSAQKRLPRPVFDFIDGGAEREQTLRSNMEAFERISLRQRVARGNATIDVSVNVFGERLSLPILLAPTGLAGMAHRDGELAAVRAAERSGTRIVLSTGSSYSLEDVANAAKHSHWFQLYPWFNAEFVTTMIGRAQRAGYSTLCVTVDVPVVGLRERDVRNGFTLPPRPTVSNVANFVRHPRWLARTLPAGNFVARNFVDSAQGLRSPLASIGKQVAMFDPTFAWKDVARIREQWAGNLVVKGIMDPEDAMLAAEAGADGVVVSNHGGRQLDGVPSTIEVLPDVVAAVGGRMAVFMDGGVRRGSDVLKAVASGATACLVGRPWLYGLATSGAPGVEAVLALLKVQLESSMQLVGQQSVESIDPHCISRKGESR